LSSTARAEFSAWPVLLAAIMGVALGPAAIAITYTLGPLIPSLVDTFGWSRAEILTIGPLLIAGALPATQVFGWLLDRYPARAVIVPAQIAMGLSFIALGLGTHSLASFYLLYFLLGATGAGASPLAFVKLLSRHFDRHRGLAIGIALAGTGLSGMFAPSYVTWMVETAGWRTAYIGIGMLPILVAAPLSIVLLRERRILDPVPSEPVTGEADEVGHTLAQALRTWQMWALAFAFLLAAGAVTAVVTNLVPMLVETGRSEARAAVLAGGIGAAIIISRIGVGWLVDRFWAPAIGALVIGAAALGTLVLATPGASDTTVLLAIFVIGLATGAEFDLNAFLASRYFGSRHLGRIYAVQYSALIVGSGIGAPASGWLRDAAGDFSWMLWVTAGGFAACAALLLTLGPYPRDKAK